MKHWRYTAAVSALLLMVTAAPAGAVDPAVPISAPVEPADKVVAMRITGELTYVDLEGGFYAVDGWRLIGDSAGFSQYVGQEVVVTGTEFTGLSFQMVPAINVASIAWKQAGSVPTDLPANLPLPREIRVNGKVVTFDQGPVAADGVLLVPLRAVVEASKGKITWDGELQRVEVRMPDRTIMMAIGDPKAELNEDGVYYLTRNLIPMAAAPRIVGQRTLISADGLTTLLGLVAAPAEAGLLNLVPAAPDQMPEAPDQVAQDRLAGRILEVQGGDRPRILVEGPAMSNGEPMLIWLSVSEQTLITLGEAAGTTADLQAGAEVVVELTGPVLESYPAQGGAASIQVIPAAKTQTMKGSIKTVEAGRILVEGALNGQPDLLWLFVGAETPIVKVVDGQEQPATVADLVVGLQVEADYSGPMLLSYPGQVGADVVRILK